MRELIGTNLNLAVKFLREGSLVAIPTETVYGLAANALDPKAVLKIFEAKNRPSFDPLIVHIGTANQLDDFIETLPEGAQKLIDNFWPGPLTLVLKKKEMVPDLVTSGLNSVAVRMPAHPLTQKLLSLLPFPLAAPSANPFGYISPTRSEHVAAQLGDKVEYILEGGPAKVGVESTIVSFEKDIPQILRWGGLELEDLQPYLGEFESSNQSSDNPSAPGMLSSHYSPRKKLILGDLESLLQKFKSRQVSYLSFKTIYDLPGIALSETGDLREAAGNLFAAMRTLDADDSELILAELVPEMGLGRAINDRLRRAAHQP
jgi:L-threonylcarbamoyladenylate synthase